jgi:hypothetical protein
MRTRRSFVAARTATVASVASVLALFGAGFSTAVLAQPTGSANAGTYTDPAGDSAGAPDISKVEVTDDPTTGMVTVSVTANGIGLRSQIDVALDTDKNASTGSTSETRSMRGADFKLEYLNIPDYPDSWGLQHYIPDQSLFSAPTRPGGTSFSRSGDVVTWRIPKEDLGDTNAFDFAVYTWAWKEVSHKRESTGSDRAPDNGVWAYDVSPRTPTSSTGKTTSSTKRVFTHGVIGKPTSTPAKPRAGKLVTIRFPVRRSDGGGPLRGATMSCSPSIDGKSIPHQERFANGVARVWFVVPKGARGRLLTVKLTIRAGASTATATAVFRVT